MMRIKKIRPFFTSIITTADKFEQDIMDGAIVTAKKGDLKAYQKVVAIGDSVRNLKVGDYVMIDTKKFAVKKYSTNSLQNDMDNNPTIKYEFNWVWMDDEKGEQKPYLFLDVNQLLYAFEGEEETNNIIVPERPKLIT